MFKLHPQKKKAQTRNYTGPWRKTPGRLLGLLLIRFYQITLSSFIGNQCRHAPTCSEYIYEAIARHGLWAGAWMGLFRIMRCGPFGTHGFDPVPTSLGNSYYFYKPWCYWKISARHNK
ncbi:putative membrane protein insertion efficiency factor [Bartonella quintana]|uniref:membrane protein insertion efficiency factor YidD n=1 Tax=Bartonella quintana TaxID=803 RepID=UPI001316F81C|nr:membrane protein insertion efficiency factor YidD [Bartonella quintana]BBL53454.1 putative membrane protein insertion efficiency factor [Bartonella quintana]